MANECSPVEAGGSIMHAPWEQPLTTPEEVQPTAKVREEAADHPSSSNSSSAARYATLMSTLSVARDGIAASGQAVSLGFGAAHTGVDAGFAIGKLVASTVFRVANVLVGCDASAMETTVNSAVDVCHSITKTSLHASAAVTRTSLLASDSMLSLTGAARGETYRLLNDYVDSSEVHEALLGLAQLLVQISGDLTVANPLKLMAGSRALALLHEQQRRDRIAARELPDAPPLVFPHSSELLDLSKHMRYAAAAYGAQAVKFLGITPQDECNRADLTTDQDAIMALTGVSHADILCVVQEQEMYRPGHFVAINRNDQEVVVAIRGTLSMHDVLVDLVCHCQEFDSVLDHDTEMIKGKAHRGFLKSAQRLANDLHELVATTLGENPDFKLVVVGHSLGGGVATLLTLLWARIPAFRERNICAFSYAAPCCVCSSISQAPFTRRHVTSIVTGDDVVSRFGLSTFRELQRAMVALAPLKDVSLEEKSRIISDLPKDDEKLYCGGRVWWLESKEYEPHAIVEVDPVKDLNSVELFPDMFAVHLPGAYVASLDKLDKEHRGNDPR